MSAQSKGQASCFSLLKTWVFWIQSSFVVMKPTTCIGFTCPCLHHPMRTGSEEPAQKCLYSTTAMVVSIKLPFISDPRILYLVPASKNLRKANLLLCKKDNSLTTFTFLNVFYIVLQTVYSKQQQECYKHYSTKRLTDINNHPAEKQKYWGRKALPFPNLLFCDGTQS